MRISVMNGCKIAISTIRDRYNTLRKFLHDYVMFMSVRVTDICSFIFLYFLFPFLALWGCWSFLSLSFFYCILLFHLVLNLSTCTVILRLLLYVGYHSLILLLNYYPVMKWNSHRTNSFHFLYAYLVLVLSQLMLKYLFQKWNQTCSHLPTQIPAPIQTKIRWCLSIVK